MSKLSRNLAEFEAAVADFVEMFEQVFDEDWDMTKHTITSEHAIRDSGTFVHPGVDDESNNWGNRGSLLASYRRLKKVMEEL